MPIPLVFNLEDNYFNLLHHSDSRDFRRIYPTIYRGWRPTDSIKMY